MQLILFRCLVVVFVACFADATGFAKDIKASDQSEKRILIITGEDGHKWRETTPILKAQIEQDSRMHVEVLDDLKKLETTDLSPYAALILHFKNDDPNIPGRSAFDALSNYVRKGGGLVIVHYASCAFNEFGDDYRALAGRSCPTKKEWKRNPLPRQMRGHDPFGQFTVHIVRHDHPITQGLVDFETTDELYTYLAGETPINTLAEATSKVDGNVYPMAFTLMVGEGRVFHIPLGHNQSIGLPGTAQLLRRGTAWVAGLEPQSEHVQSAGGPVFLFDGRTLSGWQAQDQDIWRVEDGAITGGSLAIENHGSFLVSAQSFQNFELRLKMRLQGSEGVINSGVQVRSMRVPGSVEMSGYQIDVGGGWGQIYDNARRMNFITGASNAEDVLASLKPGDWNDYRILCEGPRIRTWVNDVPVVDYTEREDGIAQQGHIGFQVHGGGKSLVQVKDIVITRLPDTPNGLTWDRTGFFVEFGGVRWDLRRNK